LKFDKTKVKKILVIKPAAIGDVLLCTPVIENLRINFPDAYIVFLTQKYCKEALAGNPFLNRILTYDLALDSGGFIVKNIRKQKYDLVIDLFGNPRTAIITMFSGARYKVGYKFNWRSIAYNIKVTPRSNEVHNVEFNLDCLRKLNLRVETSVPYFSINAVHAEYADKFFKENGLDNRETIAINPCGSWPTKVWNAEKFTELARRLDANYNVILVWGGSGERKLAEGVRESAGGKPVLIPEVDLKYLGAILKKCKAFLTNDTGPMHIGWILGVPTAAIFGPTNSHLQGPLSENSIIIKNDRIDCLGCNLTKLEECPNNHKCMNDLSVDYVMEALSDLLKMGLK
jgi:heptosyltransferase-1